MSEVLRRGIDADFPFVNPKTSYKPGEKEQFEAIRSDLDVPLQIIRAEPYQPQEGQTPLTYQITLLNELAKANPGRSPMLRADFDARDVQGAFHEVVDPVLDMPRRQGRLAEIKKIDRTGRKYSEFIGSKAAWMSRFKEIPRLMTHLDGVPVEEL
jgi:hypothetical protein